jgi:hypothetical protein
MTKQEESNLNSDGNLRFLKSLLKGINICKIEFTITKKRNFLEYWHVISYAKYSNKLENDWTLNQYIHEYYFLFFYWLIESLTNQIPLILKSALCSISHIELECRLLT